MADESGDMLWSIIWTIVVTVLCAVSLGAACYGPCEWYRGTSIARVPARCIPELAK
jgi:hypothetical protein